MRMSQAGWNNVIIFAMLAMILLFNFSSNKLISNSEDDDALRALLPEGIPIMTLQYGSAKLERIGRGWRATQLPELDELAMENLIDHWQQVIIQPTDHTLTSSPLPVVVWLAGESNGRVIQLFNQEQHLYLTYQQATYQVMNLHYADLVPTGVE